MAPRDSGAHDGNVSPSEQEGVLALRGQVSDVEAAVPSSVAEVTHAGPGQGHPSMTASVALEDGTVHAVSANMEVQSGSSLAAVRWISRLNDFLAAQGHAVFGSAGFNTTPSQGPRHVEPSARQALTAEATPTRSQHAAAAARMRPSTQGSPLEFSPPEDLPSGHSAWSPPPEQRRREGPVFSREAWEQMMSFSQRAPWLYGRGNSHRLRFRRRFSVRWEL